MRSNALLRHRDPSSPRITRNDIDTLKMKVLSKDKKKVPFKHRFESLLRAVVHYCTYSAGLLKSQCKMYGHVLHTQPKPPGEVQYCGDCGEFIRNPWDVRRAVARRR